jgi:hypothetical protein
VKSGRPCRESRHRQILLFAGLLACKSGSGKARSEIDPASLAPPELICASATYDFGDVLQGDRLSHVFHLANMGSRPLFIERIDRAYSCASSLVGLPVGLEPGAGIVIDVTCDTRERQGVMKDVLVVHAGGARAPELKLELDARVEPLLALLPMLVDLRTAFGTPASADVRVIGRLAPRARLALERVEGAGPQVTVAGDSDSPGLRLRIEGRRVGRGAGRVFVSTGVAEPATLILSYSWQVMGNLEVSPQAPYLDLRAGPKAIVLEVKSNRPDFRLDAVDVAQGPFEVRFDPSPGGRGYAVEVRAVEDRIPSGERGVLGTIVLVSNDLAEPKKEVTLFALGAATRRDD